MLTGPQLLEMTEAYLLEHRERLYPPRDHLVRWVKPKARPAWMSPQQYRAFPKELTVQELKVDGQVLVTTMVNAQAVRKGELSALYARRWHVELDLRNLKTTLGLDVLRCLTPQMLEKELWVYLAGLQRDSPADGASGSQRRCLSSRAEF